jgi:ribonuclease P protein component
MKLAASDEKDLSTPQPPTQTDSRFPGADGHARRKTSAQAPAGQGPQALGNLNSGQAARLIPDRTPLSFGAADRLHRSSEYLRLQRHGVRHQSAHFVLYAGTIGEDARSRLGITVSRRIGNAVARNRIKRRVRECFRRSLREQFTAGVSLIVIARVGAASLTRDAMDNEIITAASKLKGKLTR